MSARILVVDDVPANVKLLEARLSAEYFDVMTASNGTEALEISRRSECDIILLDVMMPDMDGFEVCRRLKTDPATHHIPVVMVTALDSPFRPQPRAGSRRRRFPHQAGLRRRADRARALADAAEDDDR
ncbi:CheY-like chemotaxis protein [Bradyrhizobium sp. LB7.2]